MRVSIELSEVDGFPDATGPHALSWSYVLDGIFADAFANGLESIAMFLPLARLGEEAQARAGVTSRAAKRTPRRGEGVALLAGGPIRPPPCSRLYLLHLGSLAPRRLRGAMNVSRPTGDVPTELQTGGLGLQWKLQGKRWIFTDTALLLGLPIRLAAVAGRRDLQDRLLFRMRREFAASIPRRAYYVLSIWERSA